MKYFLLRLRNRKKSDEELYMPTPTPSTTATDVPAITPQVEVSPIKLGELMDGLQVSKAIQGYMLQAGHTVKGVLAENEFGSAICTQNGDDNFKRVINNARRQLVPGKTRIVIPINLGAHFITVAIDTRDNTAVIVEPVNGHRREIRRIKRLLGEVFNNPSITQSTLPIQNDGYSCGPIACKIAAHLLTTADKLATAILPEKLPAIVSPHDTD